MEKFIIHTDGGARDNPGLAGAGVVIADSDGAVRKRFSKFLGEQTNNWAEYEAVVLSLQELKKIVPKDERGNVNVEIRLDSELVAKQLQGEYQIKEATLHPQFIKIWNMRVKDFPNITFTHILREENTEADKLANEAMDSGSQGNLI